MISNQGRITIILIIFLFLFSGVGANTSLELEREMERTRRERDALVEEQRKLQAELDELNKQSQTLGTTVKTLDATRRKLLSDISVTNNKIRSANQNISSLEKTMGEKESAISKHERAIATSLKAINDYDSRSLVLSLLAFSQVSEIWRDRSELSMLSGKLEEEINILRETREALQKEKEAKEKSKQELEGLQGQLSGQKQVVEQNKKAQETLLAQTKNREAEYQKMINENLERQRQFEQDLYRLEEELSIVLNKSLFPKARSGILSWPLDRVHITQRFGRTNSGLYSDNWHNGVDFRAAMGTPVKAMLSGTIEGQGNTDEQRGCYSYGRWILIKHDNGLSSVYSHLSASLVKTGQRVETGQIIAYSGGTPGTNGAGYSTGPHLHVGLFASQGVEIRLFTQSRGCKQVHVPIASGRDAYLDPLLYLPRL